jgi:hypothetical protein
MGNRQRALIALLGSSLLSACSGAPDALQRSHTGNGGTATDATAAAEGTPTGRKGLVPNPPGFNAMSLRPLYTEHLGQWTATTRDPAPVGMFGTDLGSSFERDGKLVFLFGDTLAKPGESALADQDSVAFGPTTMPADGSLPRLDWLKKGDGRQLPLTLPGIGLGSMNVPVEGVPVGDTTYIFFATGFNNASGTYASSTLAHANGLSFGSLTVDHSVASSKFVNVSVVQEAGTCHLYGSGAYRASSVFHAEVPCDQIANRNAWRYQSAGALSASEGDAAALINNTCVGELSVRKHPELGIYMMTYNCLEPRGEWIHLASSPNGPWSAGMQLWDPGDHGYGYFMHMKTSVVGYDDGLSGTGAEEDWGGDYGPYMIPQYFRNEGGGVYSIVWAVSSWNPYQTHLMRTYLGPPGVTRARPVNGQGLPKASLVNPSFADGLNGWSAAGDTFVTFPIDGARSAVSSYTAAQDAATGAIWQDFTVDATTSELTFSIHGGDGRVFLMHDGEIIRSVHGRRSNDELQVKWNVEELRGKSARLIIQDDLTGPWSFIGASNFAFR